MKLQPSMWLHVVVLGSVEAVTSMQGRHLGHWTCPADKQNCHCKCPVLASTAASLAQIVGDTPLPPLPPAMLPPYPPARLPAMPTYTSMTEDDLPTLGPPPPTTPLPTLPPTPPPMAYPFSAKSQANMLRGSNGAIDGQQNYHEYTFEPRSGSYGLESTSTSSSPVAGHDNSSQQQDSIKPALVQEAIREGSSCKCL
ncbi:unnamed protein product [Symbiodinium sp. CCMP2456]|nr:unnamed protein product [Symbiodinium sp. CCMP2456]